MEGLLTLGSSNAGRRPFGSMIVVATLNIQLAAAAKIYSIIGLFSEDERPLDVLCVQELGLDVPSAPTFVSMAQGAGLHVFLGSAESGKHRVAVISRFAGKAVHMCSDRAAAACFQLLCNGSLTKVLISSFYGCVHDEDAAMAGARAAVVGELAAGLAFSWDAAFENETLLPGTRESPTFRRLRSTEVSEEAWRAVWQAKDFEDELAAGLVNEAWVRLSDTAQDLLAEEGSHGPGRSQLWRPLTRAPQRGCSDGWVSCFASLGTSGFGTKRGGKFVLYALRCRGSGRCHSSRWSTGAR